MGIRGGKVISPVPEFEVRYGMWELRATQERYAPSTPVKIHMAVGVYHKDSAHFSWFGSDSVLMTKLAADHLKKLVRHRLDGVTIHSRNMQGTCGSPRDFKTLPGVENELELADSLDFIFYETDRFNDGDAIGCLGKVCIVVSMNTSKSDYTFVQPSMMEVVTTRPVSNISNVLGMAALFEMCTSGTVVMLGGPAECGIRSRDLGPAIVPAQPAPQ
ncbi:hypothetical protein IscW_ISCW014638 [Ixodes scapularis]|uniref:Uncharacterized protein n=1 Tax=Ixodes scapularis TaxID=6945 RepID=B7QHV7_IXOSC|nr:hypothetical protein IscW_ISCW014638 [Ixodes scapularis]|eukprot:XP_002414764.1 hypothetical protein IscW_ISCW014638 [Ixodes scapularis]